MKECPICRKMLPSTKSLASHRRKVHKIVNPLICCVITHATITVEQFFNRNYQQCSAVDCNKTFVGTKHQSKFCSQSCSGRTINVGRERSKTSKQKTAERLKSFYSIPRINHCVACNAEFNAFSKYALRCVTCQTIAKKKRSANRTRYVGTSGLLHEKQCEYCQADFSGITLQRFCSSKCRYENSTKDKKFAGQIGGYRPRAGRGHYGYYEGIWCDSTWEMAYVWHCKKQGSALTRNTVGFPYVNTKGEHRKYIPDFIVDGSYVEVKGWIRPDDPLKFAAFPHALTVVTGKQIQDIVKDAQRAFGTTKLETLFSERPLVMKNCLYCDTEFNARRQKKYCNNSCASKHHHTIKSQ